MYNKKLTATIFSLIFIMCLLVIPNISSASSYTLKYNQQQNLTIPVYDENNNAVNSSTTCFLTLINSEQLTVVSNEEMTFSTGGKYTYVLSADQLNTLGEYHASMDCSDGSVSGFSTFSIDVTGNGKEAPSGVVITLFVVLFILLLFLLTYLIIYSIGHAVTLDFDIIDAAWNLGGFFALLGLSIAERAYLGNPDVDSFLNWAIGIGAFTNVFLPVIYFILTLTVGSWMSKRVKGVDF